MFELEDTVGQQAVIKVFGVGGGGGNAVDHMVGAGIDSVQFIAANTDAQVLRTSRADMTLQIGAHLTKGLGAGANPEVGKHAAMEDRERIAEALNGTDMLFITAGMGGGTGTGAAPIVAQVARDLGILTVAVVTKPFPFEGKRRMAIAQQGIRDLSAIVDSLIVVPNEKLLTVLGKDANVKVAFAKANEVLQGAVQGIADLITRPGLVNVDFADVKTVMSEMGMAMMGTASARGEGRAEAAARAAISSPLLEEVRVSGARGMLVNITASEDLTMGEFEEIGKIVQDCAAEDANVIVGTVIDPSLGDELRVTVVATGLAGPAVMQPPAQVQTRIPVPTVVSGSPGFTPLPEGTGFAHELETPTVLRLQRGSGGRRREVASHTAPLFANAAGMDYLDVPAFLRRQAD